MDILKENRFARNMLTIAAIGAILAGLYGAERENREIEKKRAERAQNAIYYEVLNNSGPLTISLPILGGELNE